MSDPKWMTNTHGDDLRVISGARIGVPEVADVPDAVPFDELVALGYVGVYRTEGPLKIQWIGGASSCTEVLMKKWEAK